MLFFAYITQKFKHKTLTFVKLKIMAKQNGLMKNFAKKDKRAVILPLSVIETSNF